ncbi:MAG: hypothetical protein OIF58_13230, partial [Cohaesibacter sp.]|nr:hypothetical protein [Cohaesibacter sp.]
YEIQSRSSPFSSRLRRSYTKTLPLPRIPPATQANEFGIEHGLRGLEKLVQMRHGVMGKW